MSSPDYRALYADATQMKNHWWWRPGWKVGTRFYAWHLTLDGQGQLHDLADSYVSALNDVPALDPVPPQWRHITMTGMGHVEDVTDDLRDAAIQLVRERLVALDPIETTFRHASVFEEAVALHPQDPEPFTQVQRIAQAATSEVIPCADAFNPRFRAHVTTHYSHGNNAVSPIRRVLDSVPVSSAHARFHTLDLIRMGRDHEMYVWQVIQRVNIGS